MRARCTWFYADNPGFGPEKGMQHVLPQTHVLYLPSRYRRLELSICEFVPFYAFKGGLCSE